jgi:AraC family transcriptional regulator of adaptative response/methylated-DNA-[protein]-cysteine methyltransferase
MTDFHENIIAHAIDYLAALKRGEPADLDHLATKFGYEATHFQKLFKDKAGISPKRMVQYMSYTRARDFLLEGYPTLDAAYETGLSGAGRLHDLFVACEAATPGMVQKRGEGMSIFYGYHSSPIGEILVARTDVGVCWLGFVIDEDRAEPFRRMNRHWPKARFEPSQDETKEAALHVLRIWKGEGDVAKKLALDLHGTNFQIQVWRALLKIPNGGTVSYQDVAHALGDAKASRAVGTAVGSNPISLLIPCHRVIQKSGIVENYAWGTLRKKIILGLEAENIPHRVEAGRLAV